MTRAVESFSGLEHTLEPVATIGGVRFVNDSKATNGRGGQARDRELRSRPGGDHRAGGSRAAI
jgi:UDP-N-acetylmuramoylalanine-D-glutamate ligase